MKRMLIAIQSRRSFFAMSFVSNHYLITFIALLSKPYIGFYFAEVKGWEFYERKDGREKGEANERIIRMGKPLSPSPLSRKIFNRVIYAWMGLRRGYGNRLCPFFFRHFFQKCLCHHSLSRNVQHCTISYPKNWTIFGQWLVKESPHEDCMYTVIHNQWCSCDAIRSSIFSLLREEATKRSR